MSPRVGRSVSEDRGVKRDQSVFPGVVLVRFAIVLFHKLPDAGFTSSRRNDPSSIAMKMNCTISSRTSGGRLEGTMSATAWQDRVRLLAGCMAHSRRPSLRGRSGADRKGIVR